MRNLIVRGHDKDVKQLSVELSIGPAVGTGDTSIPPLFSVKIN